MARVLLPRPLHPSRRRRLSASGAWVGELRHEPRLRALHGMHLLARPACCSLCFLELWTSVHQICKHSQHHSDGQQSAGRTNVVKDFPDDWVRGWTASPSLGPRGWMVFIAESAVVASSGTPARKHVENSPYFKGSSSPTLLNIECRFCAATGNPRTTALGLIAP